MTAIDSTTPLLLGSAAATVAVLTRPAWRIVRYPVTAVHELGHAAAASLTGGTRLRVVLRPDASGVTTWQQPGTGRGRSAFIGSAGHLAPPFAGALCATALIGGFATAAVVALGVAIAVLALMVRNLWGFVVCAVLAGACWWAHQSGPGIAQALVGVTAIVLSLGGARCIIEELRSNRTNSRSDTRQLAAITRIPTIIWGTFFLAWSAVAIWWVATRLVAVLGY